MNLVHIRYVKIVAETGSFSAAARDCGVSQPTISNAISDFEAELGARLFKRTTRRVELTAFGRGLLRFIEGVLSSVHDLEQQAKTLLYPQHKLLRIAFSPIIDSLRLMTLFAPFKQACYGLEVIYKECSMADLEMRLDSEQVDVICGIRLGDTSRRGRCVLYRDVLRYLPRGGLESYRGPHRLSLPEIAHEVLILTVDTCGLAPATRELFRRSKCKLREYPGQALSYHVLQEWSQLGIGAAILPESRIIGDAKAYPVVISNRKPVMLTYEAVWSRDAAPPANFKPLAKTLKATVAALTRDEQWYNP